MEAEAETGTGTETEARAGAETDLWLNLGALRTWLRPAGSVTVTVRRGQLMAGLKRSSHDMPRMAS